MKHGARRGALSNNFVAPRFFAQAIPPYTEGMRIGLLGGSFNPPHEAHRAISQFALKRLQLDRVWWLVTPGNPLKENGTLHELGERMQAARDVADDPRIEVSCLESVIRTRYTIDTINTLRRRSQRLALCLDHGRRQPRSIPSLAALAAHRRPGADRGHRSPAAEFSRPRLARRPGACALSPARE